jgi:glyoxylase I family protein
MRPDESEAVWHLTGAGSIYVVRDADRAGTALLTIAVENLELQVAQMAERGLVVGALDAMNAANPRTAVVDPEGNKITFFEV